MTLETYWLVVPLIGIGLSGFGWLALWITRRRNHATPTLKPQR
jgi:hypothetical protein